MIAESIHTIFDNTLIRIVVTEAIRLAYLLELSQELSFGFLLFHNVVVLARRENRRALG